MNNRYFVEQDYLPTGEVEFSIVDTMFDAVVEKCYSWAEAMDTLRYWTYMEENSLPVDQRDFE
jgi:hypothetical protein